jgi:hypothetical protein
LPFHFVLSHINFGKVFVYILILIFEFKRFYLDASDVTIKVVNAEKVDILLLKGIFNISGFSNILSIIFGIKVYDIILENGTINC